MNIIYLFKTNILIKSYMFCLSDFSEWAQHFNKNYIYLPIRLSDFWEWAIN